MQKNAATLRQEKLLPPGNLLITGVTVIQNGTLPILTDAAIFVSQGKILDVGPSEEVIARNASQRQIDGSGFLIMPGLINAHTHAAMSFFRGRGHGRENMIESFMFPAEKSLTPDLLEPLSYSYIYGGLRSGVTCFADHYYFIEGVGKALERFGLRGVIGETIADLGGAFPEKNRWDSARSLIENWPFSDRIVPAVAPHAADTISPQLLTDLASFAKANSIPLHMHLSQTAGEFERVKKAHAMTPVQLAEKCGALTPQSLVVHLISATPKDWEILADTGAVAGLCTASQMIYEKLAPLDQIIANNVPFALGTDCAACNDSSDIMSEMRITGLMGKDRGIGLDKMNPGTLLNSVTTTPAKVFGLQNKIGEIAVGKEADLVFCRIDLDALPITDHLANLVYSMSSRHVQHVMVGGAWRLWNQSLVGNSIEDLQEAFVEAVDIITKRAFGQ